MHFTYITPQADGQGDLCQGDVLKRTPELEEVFESYHPHYSSNQSNRYFLVLTQTCDLVRGRGDPCKARYISVAPVRPLSFVIERHILELEECDIQSELPICTGRNKSKLQMLLERIFNNNDSDYFYLNSEPTAEFPENCCAFLRIPVALRAKEHYETCLNARLLSLSEPFQAKLGWLVGQLFSRVGTQDWEREKLSLMVKEALANSAVWIDDKQIKQLKKKIKDWSKENPEEQLSIENIKLLVRKLKPKKQQVLDRLSDILRNDKSIQKLIEEGLLSEDSLGKVVSRVSQDPTIANLLK